MAFKFSVQQLFDENPQLYFWTFTWTKKYHDYFYGNSWSLFWRQMNHKFGANIQGVRVFEPHKRGGLHCHMILNKRISVDLVRKVGRAYGIGRVHVMRCYNADAALYLAKYLKKGHCAVGVRKWARVGRFEGCRVKDVIIESPQANAVRESLKFMDKHKSRGARLTQYKRVLLQVRQLSFYGELDNYMEKLREQKNPNAEALLESAVKNLS